jgi:predicted RNA binding protein YcfA (HicA-like mRNA interferase family)
MVRRFDWLDVCKRRIPIAMPRLATRANMPDGLAMKPVDLLRRLRRLATRRDWELRIAEGSRHTKVTLNGRQTVVPRHPVDLPPGTLRAIMRQLGVSATDLEV